LKSLYAQYVLEKQGFQTIETSEGFITYWLIPENKEAYIDILYVIPEKRNSEVKKYLESLVIEEAKKVGCKNLSCVVYFKHINAEKSLKSIIAAGYKIHSASDEKVVLYKLIEGV
jgi:hypothetical protein